MADQFDFTPKVNPMQGVSLADMVAAQTPALTSILQGISPVMQALQRRKRMQQLSSLAGKPDLSPDELQQYNMGAMQMGMSPKFGLDLQKEKAQTSEQQALAQLNQMKAAAMGPNSDFTPEEKYAGEKLSSGFAVPRQMAEFFGGFGGGKSRAKALRYADMLREQRGLPPLNLVKSDVGFGAETAGAQAGARLTQGGSSQVVARTANAVYEQLDTLKRLSDQFPRTDIQSLNTPIISLLKQGSPDAQNWLLGINSVRYEYATALARGNKPGEEDIKDAKIALPDNITPAQLDAALPVIKSLLKATVRGQMTPAGGAARQAQGDGVAEGTIIQNKKTGVKMKRIGGKWQVIR